MLYALIKSGTFLGLAYLITVSYESYNFSSSFYRPSSYGILISPSSNSSGTTFLDKLYPFLANLLRVSVSVSVGYFLSIQYAALNYGISTAAPRSRENLICSSYDLFS